jgi:sec-independent protein translocase protein TatA
MRGLGGPELIVILVVMLLLFGGKKIPELMSGLGKGVREFKDAHEGKDDSTKS